jgi:hypothetical protein
MSQNKIVFRNKNQIIINTDLTKTFVFNDDFYSNQDTFYYNNSASVDVLIPEGTVLGRVTSTGFLIPWVSTASDGSERPVGILVGDVWVEYGEVYQEDCTFCIRGHVAAQKLGLQGSDTITTKIVSGIEAGVTLRDSLTGKGFKLIQSDQNMIYDNY